MMHITFLAQDYFLPIWIIFYLIKNSITISITMTITEIQTDEKDTLFTWGTGDDFTGGEPLSVPL